MKDLHRLVTPEEIHAYVRDLWRTRHFMDSHDDPNGYIRGLVDRFALLPRLFCEMDDPSVERSHFLAWMGIIPRRDEYENPAISDLYYLHEYIHAASIPYESTPDVAAWAQKIWDNERDASLGSEVFVYLELPGLRAETFDFEIWADRYLRDEDIVAMHAEEPKRFLNLFVAERDRAMKAPRSYDQCESLIKSYAGLTTAWADIWKDDYLEVETALEQVTRLAETSRTEALDHLQSWVLGVQGEGLCPFEAQARTFAAVVARRAG